MLKINKNIFLFLHVDIKTTDLSPKFVYILLNDSEYGKHCCLFHTV